MKKLLLTALLLATPAAWAQVTVPAGTTVMTLNATARAEVAPDTLTATLTYIAKGKTPLAVQKEVNEAVAKTVRKIEKDATVKVTTGRYMVNEQWEYTGTGEKRTRHSYWQAQQTIKVEGAEDTNVLDAAATAQAANFAMQNLNYSLSQPVTDATVAELQSQALAQVQSKAEKFAAQLNKGKVHLAHISFNGEMPRPPMVAFADSRMLMKAESMAAPVARADDMELSATVSAEVWLQD